ncbi:unnamed protein product [Soboliphyme baturini]|uniref:Uncharacterized protein n=1 Tax=Soboliphyme baturini TaxID=241478 RepID=A0A183IWW1_9BILA|nr:unnamed protein product [Soboliphyme baturini]
MWLNLSKRWARPERGKNLPAMPYVTSSSCECYFFRWNDSFAEVVKRPKELEDCDQLAGRIHLSGSGQRVAH